MVPVCFKPATIIPVPKKPIVVTMAHQRLYFLRQLKKFDLKREILVLFYRSATVSILNYFCILNMCVVRLYQPLPKEQAWQSDENSFQNCRQCSHPSNSYIKQQIQTQMLAIWSQTKLTPLIICSNYYVQAKVLEASVRKQIALEIGFTTVP